ncbi:hypothetical protein AZJ57_11785, partial [Streptococcus pneumoniae]
MSSKQFNNLCKQKFPNSCHFIFKKCSQRIQKKYKDLKLKRLIDFHSDEKPVPYTHFRAHETVLDFVCRLLLEKKKNT